MRLAVVRLNGKVDKAFNNSTEASTYAKKLLDNGITRQDISCKFEDVKFSKIIEMFDKASESIEAPQIKFAKFKLTRAMTGNYVGAVYVKSNDGGWYARIERNGSLTINRSNPMDGIETELLRLAESPDEYAAEYGHKTSRCCFCARKLTKGRSLLVGYGPICADNFGLPY